MKPNHQHTLKKGMGLDPETSGNLHILMRLSVGENSIEFCRCESFKSYRIEEEQEIYTLFIVHLDVILVNDQLDALFLNVFISCLCMFRVTSAHHQEDQLV
jgi:hypothetical protein